MSVLKLNEPFHFPFGKLSPLSHLSKLPLLQHRDSTINIHTKFAKSIASYVYAGLIKHNYVILDADEKDIFNLFEKTIKEQYENDFKENVYHFINEKYKNVEMRRLLIETGDAPFQFDESYPFSRQITNHWLEFVMKNLRIRIQEQDSASDLLKNDETRQIYYKKIRNVYFALQRKASEGYSLEKYFNQPIDVLYSTISPGVPVPTGQLTKEGILSETDREDREGIEFILDQPLYSGILALFVHNNHFNKNKFDEINLHTIRRAFLLSLKNMSREERVEFSQAYEDPSFDQRLLYFYKMGEITIPSQLSVDLSNPMKKGEMTFEQIKQTYDTHLAQASSDLDQDSPPHRIGNDVHSLYYGEEESVMAKAITRLMTKLDVGNYVYSRDRVSRDYQEALRNFITDRAEKRVRDAIRYVFKNSSSNYLSRLLVSTKDAKFKKHSISYDIIVYENYDYILGTGPGGDGSNLYGKVLMEHRDAYLTNLQPLEQYEYEQAEKMSKMSETFNEHEQPFMMKKIDDMISILTLFHQYQNKRLSQQSDVKVEECYFIRNLLMTCVECINDINDINDDDDYINNKEVPSDFTAYLRTKGLRPPKQGISYLWEYILKMHGMLRKLNIDSSRYNEILHKFEVYSNKIAKESMQIQVLYKKMLDISTTDAIYKNHVAHSLVSILQSIHKYFTTFHHRELHGKFFRLSNDDVEIAFQLIAMKENLPMMIDEDNMFYPARTFLHTQLGSFMDDSADAIKMFVNAVSSIARLPMMAKRVKMFQSCEKVLKHEDPIDMFDDDRRDVIIDDSGEKEEEEEDLELEEEDDMKHVKTKKIMIGGVLKSVKDYSEGGEEEEEVEEEGDDYEDEDEYEEGGYDDDGGFDDDARDDD